jgi:cytochrome P450
MQTFKPSLFLIIPGYRSLPTERVRTRKRTLHTINQAVNQIITMRRKDPKIGVIDLLGTLLKAKDSNTGVTLTDKELNDLCLTFLVAGHETTSVLLSWSLYAFAKYPEVQKKMPE